MDGSKKTENYKKERKSTFNFGLIITCVLSMALVHAQVMTFSGIFVAAVTEDLGGTRAAFSIHITISLIMCIILSSLVGKLYEVSNVKRIMIVSTILASLCSLCYSLAENIWVFYVVSIVMGCCGVTLGGTTVSILINRSFADTTRGKAMGIAMAGSGLGGMVFTPLISLINGAIGWRWSYRLLAFLIIIMLLPMVAKFVEDGSYKKTDLTSDKNEFKLETIIRGKFFWFLMFLICCFGFTCMILNNVGYVYFCEVGLTAAKASYVASVLSGSLILGKILVGTIADRYGNKVGVLGAVFFQMISYIFAVLAKQTAFFAVPTAIFYGLGNSLATVGLALFVSDLYGVENYSKIGGIMLSSLYIGNAIGPIVASAIFDKFGSYLFVLWISLVLNIFMAISTYLIYNLKIKK